MSTCCHKSIDGEDTLIANSIEVGDDGVCFSEAVTPSTCIKRNASTMAIDIEVEGEDVMEIDSDEVRVLKKMRVSDDTDAPNFRASSTGSALDCAYSNDVDIGTGIYFPNTSQVSIALADAPALHMTSSSTESIQKMEAPQFVAEDGLESNPSFGFASRADGMYLEGTSHLGFATDSVLRVGITDSIVTTTLPIRGPIGTNLLPAYSYDIDPNTGMYRVGADNLGFSTGGTCRLDLRNAAFTTTVPIYSSGGGAGAPAFTFNGDTNTGVFSDTADEIGISTAGTERLTIADAAVTTTVPILTPSITIDSGTSLSEFSESFDVSITLNVAESVVLVCHFQRINDMVHVSWDFLDDTWVGNQVMESAAGEIPVGFRPLGVMLIPNVIRENATIQLGQMLFWPDGAVHVDDAVNGSSTFTTRICVWGNGFCYKAA